MTLPSPRNEPDSRVHDLAVCAGASLVLRLVAWGRDASTSCAELRETAPGRDRGPVRMLAGSLRGSRLRVVPAEAWAFST